MGFRVYGLRFKGLGFRVVFAFLRGGGSAKKAPSATNPENPPAHLHLTRTRPFSVFLHLRRLLPPDCLRMLPETLIESVGGASSCKVA